MSLMTDAYAAGLVDGEGCISIGKSGSWFTARVDIGMTIKAEHLLTAFRSKYGGSIRCTRPATERWEEAKAWSIHGPSAAVFLRRIKPHLRLKEEQARLAILVEEIRLTQPKSEGGRSRWRLEDSERCRTIYIRMKELNQKGPVLSRSRGMGGTPYARLVAGTWVTDQTELVSDLGLEQYSATWPRSGSMRNGQCYRRAPWVHHKHVSGCSLWPTPTAAMGDRGWGLGLHDQGRYRASMIERVHGVIRLTGRWRPPVLTIERLMGLPDGWLRPAVTR